VGAEAELVHTVVVEDHIEVLAAVMMLTLPCFRVVEQVIAHGRAQELGLGLVLDLHRRRGHERFVTGAVEELDRRRVGHAVGDARPLGATGRKVRSRSPTGPRRRRASGQGRSAVAASSVAASRATRTK
jgi:hypothetical protein